MVYEIGYAPMTGDLKRSGMMVSMDFSCGILLLWCLRVPVIIAHVIFVYFIARSMAHTPVGAVYSRLCVLH